MLVLLGESGSGKSTLQKMLVESDLGYEKVVTYTTRPKRTGEVDGIDYRFISDELFHKMKNIGCFVETMQYRDWFYGTREDDCAEGNKVIVMNPPGLRTLHRRGIPTVSVYLQVDRATRLINMIRRGDNIEEAYRRNITDVGQFSGLENEVDYVINNEGFKLNESQVLEALKVILK